MDVHSPLSPLSPSVAEVKRLREEEHEPLSPLEPRKKENGVPSQPQMVVPPSPTPHASKDGAPPTGEHDTTSQPEQRSVKKDEVPEYVHYTHNVENNGLSLERVFRGLSQTFLPLYFGLKVSLLVTLPLCILAFSSRTKGYFEAGSLLPVVATANCQIHVGSQLSGVIVVLQAAVWEMIWGTVMVSLGVVHHEGAWWGLAFLGIIIASLFTNLRARRLMMCYTLITMQFMRTPGGTSIARPAKVASNLILAVCFSGSQCFVPYPLLVSRRVDRTFSNAWKSVGKIAHQLRDGVWSGRAFSGYVRASRTACDDLNTVIDSIPGELFLASYEPFERSLYNQLRNVRLTLLRRLLVILHASCTAAQSVASMSSAKTRPGYNQWKSTLNDAVNAYLAELERTLAALGTSLEPSVTVQVCNFDVLQEKKDQLLLTIRRCVSMVASDSTDAVNAPVFYTFIYFHMLLALLAEELHTFGEQMANFDPSQYKSTWRRAYEFFFLDFWNDLRYKMLGRIILRTHADRESMKEGLKFACAYCVAAAFTTRLNSDDSADTYYFGMSIIIGIGLPTVSESIEVGIQRVCGMAFALAVGYLAEWKTNTQVQAIAILVAGAFVFASLRSSNRYMHVAWYTSFTSPAVYGIAKNRITMISRVVDNSFAVMSYFIICATMFPVNPFRALWNRRAIVEQNIVEAVYLLSATAQLPVSSEYEDIAAARLQIVMRLLKVVQTTLSDTTQWIEICVKQPVLVGSTFPIDAVTSMQMLLTHIAAGLEVWVLGLQILHRKRDQPVNALIMRAIMSMRPVLADLELTSRVVFQDLIDAVEDPLNWTLEQSFEHFDDFVTIRSRLETVFHSLHQDMIGLVHTAVLQRTEMKESSSFRSNGEVEKSAVLNNRSFVGASSIQVNPNNVCAVHEHGDRYDPRDAVQGAAVSRGHHTPAAVVAAVHNYFHEGVSRRSGNANAPGQQTASAVSVAPVARPIGTEATNFSFRAPVGDLPLDVDANALTITVVSVTMVASSLEQLVPHLTGVNNFERSRAAAPKLTLKSFYMCS